MTTTTAPASAHTPVPATGTLRTSWGGQVLGGLVLFAGWFCAPAVPESLAQWPALRTEMFFQGLALTHPAGPGDGPLALLLQPVFGRGHTLAHIIWEFAAALFIALTVSLALLRNSRSQRLLVILALLAVASVWREAGYWFAAALTARLLGQNPPRIEPFLIGVALGIFSLIDFNFLLLGAGLLLLHAAALRRWQRDTPAALAGWLAVLITGWTLAHAGFAEACEFIGGGRHALASSSLGQSATALLLLALTLLACWRRPSWTFVIFTAALAPIALPLHSFPPAAIRTSLPQALHNRLTAWSVLQHPERFAKRVLAPAWNRLLAGHALPQIRRQIEAGIVDVVGAPQLVALANSLRHQPGSHRTGARAVLAPENGDATVFLPAGKFSRLLSENGYALYVPTVAGGAGFSPWANWQIAPSTNIPSLMESPLPPESETFEGHTVNRYALPARLVFGPMPFASSQVVGKYSWTGGAGLIRVLLRLADGTSRLLLEQGLNPELRPENRGTQNFTLDLPDSTHVWIELEARSENPADHSGRFRLIDLEFKRDITRMMATELTAEYLHDHAGFIALPAFIFSASEAGSIKDPDGSGGLMVHMPAAVALAKPRQATRLTGTYGFLSGAYATTETGTAGAIFNIVCYSGTDLARQIFSRTLKPKTEAADRGVQKFDLDLTGLPDGILHISIKPAVNGDTSWGWTYLGNIDLQTADPRPADVRFAEMMEAYRANLRPAPALIITNEQKPQLIRAGATQLVRIHAPGEAILAVTAGRTKATGQFGFADEAWQTKGLTDGADFVVLWRDYRGDVELFRRNLAPQANPADRGIHKFSVNLTDRGSGLLVLRSEPGPSGKNYWDWTGWSDVTVQ